jgi:hypothetical protein
MEQRSPKIIQNNNLQSIFQTYMKNIRPKHEPTQREIKVKCKNERNYFEVKEFEMRFVGI